MTTTTTPGTPAAQPSSAYRWLVLVVISLAMFGNYYIYDSIAPIADILKSDLGFTDEKTIDKRCQGFRVQKTGHTAGNHKRTTAGSIAGFQGDPGAVQNVEQIGVVVFKRDGKGDDVGIGQGSVRLHGGWPCLFRCVRFR